MGNSLHLSISTGESRPLRENEEGRKRIIVRRGKRGLLQRRKNKNVATVPPRCTQWGTEFSNVWSRQFFLLNFNLLKSQGPSHQKSFLWRIFSASQFISVNLIHKVDPSPPIDWCIHSPFFRAKKRGGRKPPSGRGFSSLPKTHVAERGK